MQQRDDVATAPVRPDKDPATLTKNPYLRCYQLAFDFMREFRGEGRREYFRDSFPSQENNASRQA